MAGFFVRGRIGAMNNDEKIIELLTEIRDHQRTQLEWSKGAVAGHRRGALIAAIVGGIGAMLLYWGLHSH